MSIKDHEFVDFTVGRLRSVNDTAVVIDTQLEQWVAIYKRDVIALAKHFKLTADDINNTL